MNTLHAARAPRLARQRPAPRRRAPPLGHRGRPARRLAPARHGRVLHNELLAAPEHAPLVLVQRRHDAVERRLPPGKLRREGVSIEHVDEQRPRAVVQEELGVVLDLPRVEVGEGDGVGVPEHSTQRRLDLACLHTQTFF